MGREVDPQGRSAATRAASARSHGAGRPGAVEVPPMIGIIGGTGLLEGSLLAKREVRTASTPFGPADLDLGSIDGTRVAVIQRHGRRHDRPPHLVAHAANLAALRALGARGVIGIGSAGCLRDDADLPALLVPDDYVSFGDDTIFADRIEHVTPGFDDAVRRALLAGAREAGVTTLEQGIYWQTRGPRLETRAEIALIRRFADCVGMTIGSEATAAKELGVPYAAICTLDNYAHGVRDAVPTYEAVKESAARNADACLRVVRTAVRSLEP
jgi:5'-methylthioadenosine phosphorylase